MEQFKFNKKTAELFVAILSLKNLSEAEKFFRDLCTPEEILEMSERWQIAKLLAKGETYRQISARLKVSTTTVSRVAAWYFNGTGGYRLALAKSSSHHNSSTAFRKS